MRASQTQVSEPLFDVVFEGHYVKGRDPVTVRDAFATRFGDSVAQRVLAQDSVILKRRVTKSDAQRFKGVLADVGMVVTFAPTTDSAVNPQAHAESRSDDGGAGRTIVERAAERARARRFQARADESAAATVVGVTSESDTAAPSSASTDSAPSTDTPAVSAKVKPPVPPRPIREILTTIVMAVLFLAVLVGIVGGAGWWFLNFYVDA